MFERMSLLAPHFLDLWYENATSIRKETLLYALDYQRFTTGSWAKLMEAWGDFCAQMEGDGSRDAYPVLCSSGRTRINLLTGFQERYEDEFWQSLAALAGQAADWTPATA